MDQARRDYLNEKYPSAGHPQSYEKEFRNNTIDRQVDGLMNDALNLKRFNDNKLMVPSDAELRYRANIPAPTNPEVIIPREPLSEGLLKRDRPNPTPPTDKPKPIPDAPRTSPASPPPTPRTTGGGGSAIDMQVAPPTAAPRQTMNNPNPSPGAKPSGLPGPAGRFGYPAAGAAVDLAFRLAAGQPLGQAAAGAVGSGIGSAAGFAAGATLTGGNPIAAYAGGMIGGYLGGMAGSALYNLAFPPTAEAPQGLSDPKTGFYPFNGGQGDRILYNVTFAFNMTGGIGQPDILNIGTGQYYGPIIGVRFSRATDGNTTYTTITKGPQSRGPYSQPLEEYFRNSYHLREPYIAITNISRADGQPDTGGNPPPLPIPKDTRTPDSVGHPGNTGFTATTAAPTIINNQTNITNTLNPPVNNYVPGGLKSKSGGNPRGDSPDWIPKGVPAPVPHPNYSPPPVAGLPGSAPSGSPSSTGAPAPSAVGNPNKSPFSFSPDGTLTIVTPGSPLATGNPKTNPADTSFPGSLQPNPLTANPLSPSTNFSNTPSPDAGTPSGLPTTIINQPIPDAYRETPVVPAPTPSPTPTAPTNQPDFDDLKKRFDEQALLLVGLTSLLNPIANNTTPEALRNAAETGTCRTLQPGGCMAPLAKNAQDAANNSANNSNKLDALNTALQGLDLSLLKVIDNKLGPQLPDGGISGFLGKFFKAFNNVAQWLHLDRVINILTFTTSLHNAYMLSSGLSQTLFSMFSNVLGAIGIKDAEGNAIDVNGIVGKTIDNLAKQTIGAETVDGIKKDWAVFNRIYQAGANIVSSFQSIASSIQNGIDALGSYTGKIGNALKRFGVVGERAYGWMSENMNTRTGWLDRLESSINSAQEITSNIDTVASSVLSVQDTVKQLRTQQTEFETALKAVEPKPTTDNKPVQDKNDADKVRSQSATITLPDLDKPDE